MLNIYFGDFPNAIYNSKAHFNQFYTDEWILNPVSKKLIAGINGARVINANTIWYPLFQLRTPKELPAEIKTMIDIVCDPAHIFNASMCSDKCAKWLLKIAEKRDITINLRHLMDFGKGNFQIKILNTGVIVNNMSELVWEAGEFV